MCMHDQSVQKSLRVKNMHKNRSILWALLLHYDAVIPEQIQKYLGQSTRCLFYQDIFHQPFLLNHDKRALESENTCSLRSSVLTYDGLLTACNLRPWIPRKRAFKIRVEASAEAHVPSCSVRRSCETFCLVLCY